MGVALLEARLMKNLERVRNGFQRPPCRINIFHYLINEGGLKPPAGNRR